MKRRTIGVLLDTVEHEYQQKVLAGIEEHAREQDVDLLVFAGGVLARPGDPEEARNQAHALASAQLVDGLVVFTGTLVHHVGPAGVAQFCKRFAPLPLASVGLELPGSPSILVDNARGMRALLLHLIQVHGYTRIAFIRGPELNAEAESRYAVYRAALAEQGLPVDPALVVEGNFEESSGYEAVATLLDERRVAVEAIVAVDDGAAIGAMRALAARGLRVPYDVAVAGFDDIESAQFAAAPLTTVRQPLHEQGELALASVLAAIRGEPTQDRVVLRTHLVVRQSCGCAPQTSLPLAHFEAVRPVGHLFATFAQHRTRIVADMAQAMRALGGSLDLSQGERLLDALDAELRTGPAGVFLSTLEEVLLQTAELGVPVPPWHGAISVLRHHARGSVQADYDQWSRTEEIWNEARVLVGNVGERIQAQERLIAQTAAQELFSFASALAGLREEGPLEVIFREQLPRMGVSTCHVVQHVDGDRTRLRHVAAWDALQPERLARETQEYPTSDILPPHAWHEDTRTTYAVFPLVTALEHWGFVVQTIDARTGALAEAMATQLAQVLRTIALQRQLSDADRFRGQIEGERRKHEADLTRELLTPQIPETLRAEGTRLAGALISGSEPGSENLDALPVRGGAWVFVARSAAPGLVGSTRLLVARTALEALAQRDPDVPPQELVAAVTALLRSRSAEVDRVELGVLQIHRSGRVSLAGPVPEGFIWRDQDERCVTISEELHQTARGAEGERLLQLEEADLIVFCSRSLFELRNEAGDQFGEHRVRSELDRLRYEPVERIRDDLEASVRRFSAHRVEDLSLLVGRYGVDLSTLSMDELTRP